jgi:hypothetical protein
MDKQIAINLLGGSAQKVAKALGYKSVQAVYLWPDQLPIAIADRVNGAALRLKRRGIKATRKNKDAQLIVNT